MASLFGAPGIRKGVAEHLPHEVLATLTSMTLSDCPSLSHGSQSSVPSQYQPHMPPGFQALVLQRAMIQRSLGMSPEERVCNVQGEQSPSPSPASPASPEHMMAWPLDKENTFGSQDATPQVPWGGSRPRASSLLSEQTLLVSTSTYVR